MLAMMEITHSSGMFLRTRLDQRASGVTTLQKIRAQYMGAYAPVMRLRIMYSSYLLPLYTAMKASIMYP